MVTSPLRRYEGPLISFVSQEKAISHILCAISLHSVWEDPQDAAALAHRDRGCPQSFKLYHHIRLNDDRGLLDLAAMKPRHGHTAGATMS